MKVSEILEKHGSFVPLTVTDSERDVSSVYCCDLLSHAMGGAPENCAWITVMSNPNTIAVALLADVSLIVFAGNAPVGDDVVEKAKANNINLAKTSEPIFVAAKAIDCLLC